VATQTKQILVVGGGIAGITAALEAAEVGHTVVLIEKNFHLGGRVAQMYRYFPKLCPPSCGLEINFKRLRSNRRVRVITGAELTALRGEPGDFTATVKVSPRYVNERCTCCGECAKACTLEVDDPFNLDMSKVKAAHRPYSHSYPARYRLHPSLVGTAEAEKVKAACPAGAIDLDDKEREIELPAAAVVWATGWEPFDPSGVSYYGFGKHRNVITNLMLERLASPEGPTAGKILRPSDGQPPKSVLFVQCAGSRDENHLPYCSGVCCLGSLKQATYLREQLPESSVTICYIDIRTPDRLEDFYQKVQKDPGVRFVKSKVADITEEAGGSLKVRGEDTLSGKRFEASADLVVLATGIVPSKVAPPLRRDAYGFLTQEQAGGQLPAGCAVKPAEVSSSVQDGTAAALRAIQMVTR
jgi:quinone-modifying oxidoreductase subunit QmoA